MLDIGCDFGLCFMNTNEANNVKIEYNNKQQLQ